MASGELLLLLLKMLGMLMNERLWRGYRGFGSKLDCRGVDIDWYGHVIEAGLEAEEYRRVVDGTEG